MPLSCARVRWKSDRASRNLWAAGEPGVEALSCQRAGGGASPSPTLPQLLLQCGGRGGHPCLNTGGPHTDGLSSTWGSSSVLWAPRSPACTPDPLPNLGVQSALGVSGLLLGPHATGLPMQSPTGSSPAPTRIPIAPRKAPGSMRRGGLPQSPPAPSGTFCGGRACPAARIPSLGRARRRGLGG